jgi:Rrf2 family protein
MAGGNSRFAVAVHALTLLSAEDRPLTSEHIASSVNTNPVVIRRLLATLRNARLVESRPGAGGGWTLARAPEAITLRDVYRAAEGPRLFALPAQPPAAACPVGSTIQRPLLRQFELAQQGAEAALGRATISDMLRQTRAWRG